MYRSSYLRIVSISFDAVCLLVASLGALMLAVTLADHFLVLHWGWDFRGAWVLPLIVFAALLLRFIGKAFFRMFEHAVD